MEPTRGEPAPSFPMTARDALLYLLRTHDGAAHGDPTTVRDTAERYLRARPDDAEIRDAYDEGLRARGTPGA